MTTEQIIREHVRRALSMEQFYCQDGTVVSVDEDSRTIEVETEDGGTLKNVRLQAGLSGEEGHCIFPKVGTGVTVAMRSKTKGIMVVCDEIDKIFSNIENEWVINGGTNGGLINIEPLVKDINTVKKQINDILGVLKNTTIPLAPSGTYPFAPLYATLTDLSDTDRKDIEDEKVKH